MKKSWIFFLLLFLVIIGFFVTKEGRFVSKFLIRNVKAWMFKDRINQMFRENQALIDRLLVVCENADGENKVVDKSMQIALGDNNWINTYGDLVFNEESELKIDEGLFKKIDKQLRPIRSDYNKLSHKYKDIIDQKSQVGSGVNEKLIGYTLNELWMEIFWILGSSLSNDLNDYRRNKKVVAMTFIALYLNDHYALDRYLKNRILLEAAESGELKEAFVEAEQAFSDALERTQKVAQEQMAAQQEHEQAMQQQQLQQNLEIAAADREDRQQASITEIQTKGAVQMEVDDNKAKNKIIEQYQKGQQDLLGE